MARRAPQSNYEIVPPPRRVPLRTQVRVLFSGMLSQFGWIFFGFGLIFFWVFVPLAEFEWLFASLGGTQETVGTVTDSDETGASENETPVYVTMYKFTVDGNEYEDYSYATGTDHSAGATVPVEYATGNPGVLYKTHGGKMDLHPRQPEPGAPASHQPPT